MIYRISDFKDNNIPNINYENMSQEEKILVIEKILEEYQLNYNNAIGYEKVYYYQIIKALKSVIDDLIDLFGKVLG